MIFTPRSVITGGSSLRSRVSPQHGTRLAPAAAPETPTVLRGGPE